MNGLLQMIIHKDNNGAVITMGRRRFLIMAGSGLAAGALAPQFFAQGSARMGRPMPSLSKFTEQLPIPGTIDATSGSPISLEMAPGSHKFHSSLPETPTWGYGGADYLGPTIVAKRGVSLTMEVNNSLGAHPLAFAIDTELHGALEDDKTGPRTSVHLHGGNTEPNSDGSPTATFVPGETYTYNYANDQEATTLWYHDHALGITRLNVYAGLAGFYLLRDEFDTGLTDNPLGLPAGPYEIPIVIQDKMFNADGSLEYPEGMQSIWAPEFFGNVSVVNGKAFPNLNVKRGLYRFRMLNGSNARVYDLGLSNGQTMYQIGGDGGLLNRPIKLKRLILAPGERADILIDFSGKTNGSKIVLTNNARTPFPDGPRSMRLGGMPIPEIMRFTVGPGAVPAMSIPSVLRDEPVMRLTSPVRTRNVTLVELIDAETGVPTMALLNNLPFSTTEIATPIVDTVEQWNIINTTGDTHPIHLHLVQFQLIGRQRFNVANFMAANYPGLPDPAYGGVGPYPPPSADEFAYGTSTAPSPGEMGWKDTIRANPGEITRIMVPFGANAAEGVPFGQSFKGEYMWHCHILEHEDNEMMNRYEVGPA